MRQHPENTKKRTARWKHACRQLPEGKGSGKKGKAKKGKKKKAEKEEKGKEEGKEKGKKGKESEGVAEAPPVQAAGKHFALDLAKEDDRAVACLLAEHELQVTLHQK